MERSFLRRLAADRSGGMAVLLALAMPLIVGGFGLGTEVGLWYFKQRKLQNAADIAAFAAAAEVRAGRAAQAEAAAAKAAIAAGFRPEAGGIVVTTPFGGNAKRVEVRLDERTQPVFSALFGLSAFEMGGRAVAQIDANASVVCVLALNGTTKNALALKGNAGGSTGMVLAGCTMHANSLHKDAVALGTSVTLEVDCLSASGGVPVLDPSKVVLSKCGAPIQNATQLKDPFAGAPVPTSTEVCKPSTSFSSGTIGPGRYCGGLSIQGPVAMNPGIYIVEGNFTVNATAALTGSDVLIYLKGSSSAIKMNGGATVTLKGRLSAPYAGMAMFVDPAAVGVTHMINGNAASSIDGTIYAPTGQITFSGAMNSGDSCTRLISDTIEFTGNSSLGILCASKNDLKIESVERVRLVE